MNGVQFSISLLCSHVKMSRQNFYKDRTHSVKKSTDKALVVELIKQERCVQTEIGIRKLQKLLKSNFESNDIKIGRDALFELAREEKLLIKKKKKYCRTTDSRHGFKVYKNLIKDKVLTEPNQVWVCDITYVRVAKSFVYLALITDAFSRKIIAYNVGENLEAVGCMKALRSAIKNLPKGKYPIHHSDRGSQYCCHDYIEILKSRNLAVSMTEENHCYENSKAERINGILKYEYHLRNTFNDLKDAKKAIKQAIYLYNNCRPHTALAYDFPSKVHDEQCA
jgi:putative transposase